MSTSRENPRSNTGWHRTVAFACLALLQGIYAARAGIEHVEVDRAYEDDAGHLILSSSGSSSSRK
jgi:hypothetical protein